MTLSSQQFTNYNPDQVMCTFVDSLLGGWADGTFIKVRMLSPGFTSKAGADGLVSHTRSNDPRVEIELTFMAGSQSNDIMSTAHEADLTAANGAGVGPFTMTDLNGTSLLECTYARIMKSPDEEFAKDNDGDRVWVLEGIKAKRVVGGR